MRVSTKSPVVHPVRMVSRVDPGELEFASTQCPWK